MSRSVIKRAGTSAAPAVSAGMDVGVGEIEHPHRAATDHDVPPSVEQLADRDPPARGAGDQRAVEIEADAAEDHGNVLGEPAVVARPHLGDVADAPAPRSAAMPAANLCGSSKRSTSPKTVSGWRPHTPPLARAAPFSNT